MKLLMKLFRLAKNKGKKMEEKYLKLIDQQVTQKSENFVDYFKHNVENQSNQVQISDLRFDLNIAYQHKVALGFISKIYGELASKSNNPQNVRKENKLIDIGSKFGEVISFSHYFDSCHVECRIGDEFKKEPRMITSLDIELFDCEAQNILKYLPEQSYSIVTCLHALEHFGLGRYGDEIDYYGDQKGLKVFNKLLKDEGYLVLSVPYRCVGDPKIEYNSQRVYSTQVIDDMLVNNGFEILNYVQIDPHLTMPVRDNEGVIRHAHVPLHRSKNKSLNIEYDKDEFPVGVYITLSKKIKE